MEDERRYHDEEVAEIIRRAAAPPAATSGSPIEEGVTLAELQAIGEEVGIAPQRVAAAAAALDAGGGSLPVQRSLGIPISAGRTVPLPRAPTDREWDLLLGEIRQTFGAHGKESTSGNVRLWRNGNLRVYLEPSEGGYRLRMMTRKSNAAPSNLLGVGALVMGALMMLILFMGLPVDPVFGPLMLLLAGSFLLGRNAILLPRWANEREAQFAHLAERAQLILATPERPSAVELPPAGRHANLEWSNR